MTSKELIRKSLLQSGLPLLSKADLHKLLESYLSSPEKGETLVFSEYDYELYQSPLAPMELKPNSFQSISRRESEYSLDTARDLFLKDHRLDGNYIFPLAKACYDFLFLSYLSDGSIISLKDVEVYSPIFIKKDRSKVRLSRFDDSLVLNAANGSIGCKYSEYKPKEIIRKNQVKNSVCPYSQQILFHGPYFQKLKNVHLIEHASYASLDKVATNLKDSITQIIDCCLQLLTLEKSYFENKKLLPLKIRNIYLAPNFSMNDVDLRFAQ